MLATRLVHLIEMHADQLSHRLIRKLENDPHCVELRKVPAEELRARSYEVYHHLADWLVRKTEHDLRQAYVEIGVRRAHQGVAFSHVLYALTATKGELWTFLEDEGIVTKPIELFGEMELFRLLDQFFDRALYYAATGYEQSQRGHAAAAD
jgi:hypothetical protein